MNRRERPWQYQRRRIGVAKKLLAHAMRKSGHTYRDIARALDISISSVHLIVREEGGMHERLSSEIRKRSVAHNRLLAEQILSTISDRDIRQASLKTKVIAAAILTDKALLLEKSAETPVVIKQNIEQVIEHDESPDFSDSTGT